MKLTMLVFLIMGYLSGAHAQSLDREVIAAQGNSIRTTAVKLSWTTGEVLAGPLQAQGLYINQGFQQGTLKMDATAVKNLRNQLKVIVFPNPTARTLNLERETAALNSTLIISIFTAEGRRLDIGKEWATGDERTSLDLRHLPAGSYFLHLSDKEATMQATLPFQKIGAQ